MVRRTEQEVRDELAVYHAKANEIEKQAKLRPVYVKDSVDDKEIEVTNAYLVSVISSMAEKIVKDFAGKSLLFLGLMDGANFFANKLIEEIQKINATLSEKNQVMIGYTTTMTSSYEGTERSELTIGTLKVEVGGLNVMSLDDVLDSGNTLVGVDERLYQLGAANVYSAVLFTKQYPGRTKEATYSGLSLGKEFLVGAGMDFITPNLRLLPTVKAIDLASVPCNEEIKKLKEKIKELNAELRVIIAKSALKNTPIKASQCGFTLMPAPADAAGTKPELVKPKEVPYGIGSCSIM